MSGLRSQVEYTITCVSLRSGSASTGTCSSENQPATAPASASSTTAIRCFAERSISLLIMAVHPALGIEQERSGHDDPLARLESLQDFHTPAEASSRVHLTRLECPGRAVDV